MIKKVYIYTLTNPLNNEVFYVGYTKNPTRRLNEHIKQRYNPCKDYVIDKILHNGLKPILNVIDECEYFFNQKENMFEHERLEIYYIKKYKDEGVNLTNLTDGGGDTNPQLKKRIFKYNQFGNYIEEYESIADAGIEHNISSTNIGHAVDQRIKNTCCGYYWFSSKEKAEAFEFKISIKNNLPILQYSLDGNFIREFKNKKEAEILLKIGRGCLCRAINSNGLKSANGYLWFYKGNVPEKINRYKKSFYKEILQYDLNYTYIKKYSSIKEASKILNICDVTIINCAKGKFSHAGGFIWRYADELLNNFKIYSGKIRLKPVLKYDKDGIFLTEYSSIAEATRMNKFSLSLISGNLTGITKTAGGFIWKYKNNDLNLN
jgi:hypothetical protein